MYPRRGRVIWNRLDFDVGEGSVSVDSSSETDILSHSYADFRETYSS